MIIESVHAPASSCNMVLSGGRYEYELLISLDHLGEEVDALSLETPCRLYLKKTVAYYFISVHHYFTRMKKRGCQISSIGTIAFRLEVVRVSPPFVIKIYEIHTNSSVRTNIQIINSLCHQLFIFMSLNISHSHQPQSSSAHKTNLFAHTNPTHRLLIITNNNQNNADLHFSYFPYVCGVLLCAIIRII